MSRNNLKQEEFGDLVKRKRKSEKEEEEEHGFDGFVRIPMASNG